MNFDQIIDIFSRGFLLFSQQIIIISIIAIGYWRYSTRIFGGALKIVLLNIILTLHQQSTFVTLQF